MSDGLEVKIDTSQVNSAVMSLDELIATGAKVETTVDKMQGAFTGVKTQMAEFAGRAKSAETAMASLVKQFSSGKIDAANLANSMSQLNANYHKTATEILLMDKSLGAYSDTIAKNIQMTQELASYDKLRAASMSQQVTEAGKLANAQDALRNQVAGMVQAEAASTQEILINKAAMVGIEDEIRVLIADYDRLKAAKMEAAAAQSAKDTQSAADYSAASAIDKMVNSLRDQIATFGMSKDQIQLYKASLIGATEQIAPMVAQLNALKDAQAASVAATKADAEAKAQAAAIADEVKAAQDRLTNAQSKLTSSLEHSIATFGKDALAMKQFEANMLGVGEEASVLVEKLRQLETIKGNEQFVESLKREAMYMGKTRAEVLELQAAEKGLTSETQQYINVMKNFNQSKFNEEIRASGKSVKELERAMMMLPAQMTDVVTSIASGMPLWLILIQQGGQVKDSFGGISQTFTILSNKAKALISGITPLQIVLGGLAAAAATAGIAMYQAASQSDNMLKALTMSGNAIGMTTDQMRSLSDAIGASTGSYANARESLLAMAESGTAFSGNVRGIATAMTEVATVVGTDIKTMVDQFKSLEDDPVSAALNLNKQMNFLTDDILKAAQAAMDNGDKQKAAAIVEDALADAMTKRSKVVRDNLSAMAQVALATKEVFAGLWKAISDGFEATSPANMQKSSLAAMKSQLSQLEASRSAFANSSVVFGAPQANDTAIATLKAQIAAQEKLISTQDTSNKKNQESAALQTKLVEAQKQAHDWTVKSYDDTKKAEVATAAFNTRLAEMQKLRKEAGKSPFSASEIEAMRKGALAEAGIRDKQPTGSVSLDDTQKAQVQLQILQRQATLGRDLTKSERELYEVDAKVAEIKEKGSKATKAEQDYLAKSGALKTTLQQSAALEAQAISRKKSTSEAQKQGNAEEAMLTTAMQRQAALKEELSNGKALTTDAQKLAEWQQKVSDIKGQKYLSAQDKAVLASATEVENILKQNAALSAQVAQQTALNKLKEKAVGIGTSMTSGQQVRQEGYNTTLSTHDLTSSAKSVADARQVINKEFLKYREDLAKAAGSNTNTTEYKDALANIDKQQQVALKSYEDYRSKEEALDGDWLAGAKSGLAEYADSSKKAFDLTKNYFTQSMESMNSTLSDFITTGTADWQSMFKSITTGFVNMTLKMAESNMMSYFTNGASGASGSSLMSGLSSLFSFNAKGGTYKSPSLHQYANSVVSKPTMFAFAKGAGIMGEAGSEAIMPLTRDSNGSLGVKALGQTSTSNVATNNVSVSIANGQATTTSDNNNANLNEFSKNIGAYVEKEYRRLLAGDIRQGGTIYNALRR